MRRTIAHPKTTGTLLSCFESIVGFRFRIQSPPGALVTSPVLTSAFHLAACSLSLFEPGMRNESTAADLASLASSCASGELMHRPWTLSVASLHRHEPRQFEAKSHQDELCSRKDLHRMGIDIRRARDRHHWSRSPPSRRFWTRSKAPRPRCGLHNIKKSLPPGVINLLPRYPEGLPCVSGRE
jgi:hypothetical protein